MHVGVGPADLDARHVEAGPVAAGRVSELDAAAAALVLEVGVVDHRLVGPRPHADVGLVARDLVRGDGGLRAVQPHPDPARADRRVVQDLVAREGEVRVSVIGDAGRVVAAHPQEVPRSTDGEGAVPGDRDGPVLGLEEERVGGGVAEVLEDVVADGDVGHEGVEVEAVRGGGASSEGAALDEVRVVVARLEGQVVRPELHRVAGAGVVEHGARLAPQRHRPGEDEPAPVRVGAGRHVDGERGGRGVGPGGRRREASRGVAPVAPGPVVAHVDDVAGSLPERPRGGAPGCLHRHRAGIPRAGRRRAGRRQGRAGRRGVREGGGVWDAAAQQQRRHDGDRSSTAHHLEVLPPGPGRAPATGGAEHGGHVGGQGTDASDVGVLAGPASR